MKERLRGIQLNLGSVTFLIMCLFMSPTWVLAADVWQPKKEIKLIVTSSPRGYYNAQARILAKELESILDTPVYVDNVPGGNQVQGVLQMNRAKPDGYTICLTGSTNLILNRIMFRAKYDLDKLVYLGRLLDGSKQTGGIFVSPYSGMKTWDDVLNSKKPVRWAAFGKGTVPWVSTKAIVDTYNMKSLFVEGYVGFEGIQAVARGEVDAVSFPMSLGISYVKKGEVIPALVLAHERYSELPDVETIADLGHSEILDAVSVHHIMLGPPKLPTHIRLTLEEAIYQAATSDAMRAYHIKAIENGVAFGPLRGEETKAIVLKAIDDLKPFVQTAK